MAAIELRSVDKVYDGDVHAVRGLDLDVADRELLVLLGPSGCGKSTVLRLVAGLESLTSGEIHVGGRRVDTEPAQSRDIAMVFQSYALYGHMTVRQNLEFPLRMRGVHGDERRRRAEEIADLLELTGLLDARPGALSGGQQQRVAMGRALVRQPHAFLLDEPLSNLDARLRAQVRAHIAEIQERLGVTTLYVTHDQVEALSLGHRVAVLRAGRLQQIGPGQDLYDRPANTFVASFLGQPGMNLMRGRLSATDDSWKVTLGGGATLRAVRGTGEGAGMGGGTGTGEGAGAPNAGAPIGGDVVVGVRPESFELVEPDACDGVVAEVRAVEALGPERIVYLESAVHTVDPSGASGGRAGPLIAVRTGTGGPPPAAGDRVGLRADPEAVYLFDADGRALTT